MTAAPKRYHLGRSRSGAAIIATRRPDGSWHLKKRLAVISLATGRPFESVASIEDLGDSALLLLAEAVRESQRRHE